MLYNLMTGYVKRKYSSSTCQLCYITSVVFTCVKKEKRGTLVWPSTWLLTFILYIIFLKTTQKKKTHLKWKLSLWLHHIHKKSTEEGWIWRIYYVYKYHFISQYCNPGRREEENNKSLDINVSAGSLSLQKWYSISSFHCTTFAQSLSHTSELLCPTPS